MSSASPSLARRIAPLLPLFAVLGGGSAYAQAYPALSETLLDTGSGFVYFDAVGDVNHDGIDDVVAVTNEAQFNAPMTIAIFLGKPDGTFAAPVKYPAPDGTGGLAIADMNLDGNADIVFGAPQNVGIMYGDGVGGFSPAALFPLPLYLGSQPASVVAASRNASTLPPECVAQGRCGPQAAVAVGSFNGAVVLEWNATSGGQMPATPIIETLPFSTGLAMNRSGTWLPPASSNGTDLFLNQFGFEALFNATPFQSPFLLLPNTVLSADLNGDGLSDWVGSDFNGNLSVSLQGPQGLGVTSNTQPASFMTNSGALTLLGASDLDGDGKVDVVGMTFTSTGNALAIFRGDGRGGFASQEYYSNPIPSFWVQGMSIGVGKVGSLGFVALPRGNQIALAWYTKGGFTVSAGADQTVVAPSGSANISLVGSVYPDGAATSYCWTTDGATCFATTRSTTLTAPLGVTVATFRATNASGQVFSSSVTLTVVSSPTTLVGPPGPQGPAGQDGAPGAPGAQGPMGLMGPAGEMGPMGPMGYPGAPGAKGLVFLGAFDAAALYQADDAVSYLGSSYVALRSTSGIAPGTDSGTFWKVIAAAGEAGAAGVAGPQGPAGPTGSQGPAGPAGGNGLQGARGADGATGAQGIAGPPGVPGPQGVAGPQGIAGLQGDAGAQGSAGPQGAQGSIGPQGPRGMTWAGVWNANANYLADDAVEHLGASYIALRSASSVAPGNDNGTFWALVAAAGVAGPQGEMGPAGPTGPKGDAGATGLAGPIGLAGATGPKGDVGATGPVGPSGPKGDAGVAGAQGAVGPQGPAGIVTDQTWSAYLTLPVSSPTVISDFTPSGSVTLTRIQGRVVPAPTGCNTQFRVQVSDGAQSATLSLAAASNDSGALSVPFNASVPMRLSVLPPSGCSTKGAQLNVVVQYRAR